MWLVLDQLILSNWARPRDKWYAKLEFMIKTIHTSPGTRSILLQIIRDERNYSSNLRKTKNGLK